MYNPNNYLLVSVVSQLTKFLIGAFWHSSSEACFVAASSYQKQNKKYREKKKGCHKVTKQILASIIPWSNLPESFESVNEVTCINQK